MEYDRLLAIHNDMLRELEMIRDGILYDILLGDVDSVHGQYLANSIDKAIENSHVGSSS